LYLCDQDDAVGVGGTTRTKLHWGNFVSNKPSTFGTLKLIGSPFTSVKTIKNSEVKVYRTAKSVYVADLKALSGKVSVQLFNINGRVVSSMQANGGETVELNMNAYSKGIYILKLNSDEISGSVKLVVE